MLNSEPNNNDYRLEVATILIDQGEEEPAAMWLQTILNDDPNHLPSHQLLAGYYSKTGRFELARVHKERADILSTRPENRQPQTPQGGGEASGDGDGDSEPTAEPAGPEVGGEQSEGAEVSGAGE